MSYLKYILKYNKYRKNIGNLYQESLKKHTHKSMLFDPVISLLEIHHKEVI